MLPSYYSPRSMGMLDPETTDGRVIFFLPWEGEDWLFGAICLACGCEVGMCCITRCIGNSIHESCNLIGCF